MPSQTPLVSSGSAGTRTQEGISQPTQFESPNTGYSFIKSKVSMTEESGGEEILYKPPPRKPAGRPSVSSISSKQLSSVYSHYRDGNGSSINIAPSPINVLAQSSPATGSTALPPSAYNQQTFPKAPKQTSDEFAMDQSGALVSKTTGLSLATSTGSRNGTSGRDQELEDKVVRRRRSLGGGVPTKPSERGQGKE
ncbi:hypothetical protein FRC12_019544 [Ceratobasidium sp. 428]|nr:hypothetical protein FRC12_019544 [Ceratobasidium sp. 428]